MRQKSATSIAPVPEEYVLENVRNNKPGHGLRNFNKSVRQVLSVQRMINGSKTDLTDQRNVHRDVITHFKIRRLSTDQGGGEEEHKLKQRPAQVISKTLVSSENNIYRVWQLVRGWWCFSRLEYSNQPHTHTHTS